MSANNFMTPNFEIATYCSSKTVCVNYDCNGEMLHRHDYGFWPIPKFLRIGWYVRSIQREAARLKPIQDMAEAAAMKVHYSHGRFTQERRDAADSMTNAETGMDKKITTLEAGQMIAKILSDLESATGQHVHQISIVNTDVTKLMDQRQMLFRRVDIELKPIPGSRWDTGADRT